MTFTPPAFPQAAPVHTDQHAQVATHQHAQVAQQPHALGANAGQQHEGHHLSPEAKAVMVKLGQAAVSGAVKGAIGLL